jgi:hypothetical protein
LSEYISPTEPTETGPPGPDIGKGVDILYYPPADSATQRAKSAGKILSLHASYPSVGLGLVRLEFAERTWWSAPLEEGATVADWTNSKTGKLTAMIGGSEWGVYVGQGEAYGAATKAGADLALPPGSEADTEVHVQSQTSVLPVPESKGGLTLDQRAMVCLIFWYVV